MFLFSSICHELGLNQLCLMCVDMDDEDGFPQVDVAKLGLIEIQFHRTVLCGLYPATDSRGAAELLSSAPVSERSKKVGWHRTAYVFPFVVPLRHSDEWFDS